MRTAQERLILLHRRADILKKNKELALLRTLGSVSRCLALCLLSLLVIFGQNGHGMAMTGYAATSLLSENAGGYVLAAAIAFFLGVVITALLIKRRKKDKDGQSHE